MSFGLIFFNCIFIVSGLYVEKEQKTVEPYIWHRLLSTRIDQGQQRTYFRFK